MNPQKKPNRDQKTLGDALFGTRLGETATNAERKSGADLFIVDNSDSDWKVKQYLSEWTQIASGFDIATGYFEIGALLALDGEWQKLDKLRILMGDEVSMRTRKALLEGIETAKNILDRSLEAEKENNDFLTGVPAVVEALQKKQIECKIYRKDKFHAKAYISSDDLEELKKLLVAVDNHKISLYITKQVINEFRRNREAKIADALKIFNSQKIPNQFPQMCKTYEEYATLRELLKSFSKTRNELLERLKTDIDSNTCGADVIINGLFKKANVLELDDAVLEDAKNRVSLGNPPGSSNSYGDSVNWELLLKHFPKDEELHFVTEDTKDYSSKIERGRLSEFLNLEWIENEKSTFHFYTKLSDFLYNEFPNIKLASELEKELAINSFVNSSSFSSTKSAIRKLKKFTFTDSEIIEIVEAGTTNNQIYWIGSDSIVKNFLLTIIEGREDVLDPAVLEEFNGIYGEGIDSNQEEDEPF